MFISIVLLVGVIGFVHADSVQDPGAEINSNFRVRGDQGSASAGANGSLGIQTQDREREMNNSQDYNQSQERDRERIQNQTHFENETEYQFRNSDGQEYNITLRNRFMAGGNESEQEIEFHGYNVSSRLNVRVENQGNESRLRVNLSNGEQKDIKVLPDVASQRAIQVFQNRNITVVLKQVGNGTNASVVYDAMTNKTVSILGLFRARAQINAQIDSETGQVISINKPWWYFLTFGSGTLNTNPSNETNGTNISVNESSNVSGNASA